MKINFVNSVYNYTKKEFPVAIDKLCSGNSFVSKSIKNYFPDSDARVLNKIAKHNLYCEYANKIPAKASKSDLDRILSDKCDDSYNRAVWISPKTRVPYYLLKEDETKKGIVLRVLNKDGSFLKNAVVKPKKIVIGDLSEGDNYITRIFGVDFCHSDFMEIIARRYNPFAKINTVKFNDDYELLEYSKNITPDTSCIELSYGIYSPVNPKSKGKDVAESIYNRVKESAPDEIEYLKKLQALSKQTKVLMSSGNDGEEVLNVLLINTGFEGVGGLNKLGCVDNLSSSRSSYFTQHYENFNYPVTTTRDGINICGLRGTDVLIEHSKPSGKFLYNLRGTSFAAPVRAAKLALNDMLKDLV